LNNSEQASTDEPQCRRYRSVVDDDAVDFEQILQDVSVASENQQTECSANRQTVSQECEVAIKSEPESDSEEQFVLSDSQPLNFSLNHNSSTADETSQRRPDAHKIRPSSPDLASSSLPIDHSASYSSQLGKQLEAAVAANLALQEELSARDFHLAQLAEDFFCLHEQFKQLARHFQEVLHDIEPVSEQSAAVSQNTHNHAS